MLKRKLPLLLVVLVALGLLFGGSVHSTLHDHDGGHDGGGEDCDFCHLTALPAVDAAPVVSETLPVIGSAFELPERIPVRARRDCGAPRAPPAA